jgi:hypothetical protein
MIVCKVACLFFILVLCFGAPLLMKQFTKGFHLSRLVSKSPDLDQNFPKHFLEKEKLVKILSQSFKYLNRGAQSFVFESQDHKYVLKLFHENSSPAFFPKWKKNKPARRTGVEGSLIAYREASDETGLLYLHLYPTEKQFPKVKIYDSIGRVHRLSLDRYFFVIQKKTEPFDKTLFKASLEGDLSVYFRSYFSLLDSRIGKGIWNEDVSLSSNFGFLGKRAIEIDFGRYVQRDQFLHPKFQAKERKRFTQKLREFIALHLPNELDRFDRDLAQFEESKKSTTPA